MFNALSTIGRGTGWLIFAILSLGVAAYALGMTSFLLTPGLEHGSPSISDHIINRPNWFAMHIIGGGVALAIAPFQFIGGLRRKWPISYTQN